MLYLNQEVNNSPQDIDIIVDSSFTDTSVTPTDWYNRLWTLYFGRHTFLKAGSVSGLVGKPADFVNQSPRDIYSANIPGVARISGETAESMFTTKLKQKFCDITGHQAYWCLRTKGQVKEMSFETFPSRFLYTMVNQSINRSNFYSANIPGVARLSGAKARSVFKYKVVEAIP